MDSDVEWIAQLMVFIGDLRATLLLTCLIPVTISQYRPVHHAFDNTYNGQHINKSVWDLFNAFCPSALYPYVISHSVLLLKVFLLTLATNYNDNAPYRKSVEDVSEETRYILEEFIIERAAEDGVDMSLVKPIIDVDLSARMFPNG